MLYCATDGHTDWIPYIFIIQYCEFILDLIWLIFYQPLQTTVHKNNVK